MYWYFVLLTTVDLFVELLGEWPEDQAELMKSQFFWFSGIEIYHIIILNSRYSCKIGHIFWGYISFVPCIYQLEEVDKVEIIIFGKVFSEFLQPALLQYDLL